MTIKRPYYNKDLDLNQLIQLIAQSKGGEPQQYKNLMDTIAYHETGALQRMNPRAMQEGGGPGRGLFMFEEGYEEGGNTAVNRTHTYLKNSGVAIPEWLNDIWEGKKSVDASKLSAEKQKMLFLGNYMEHPKANLADVISGDMNTKEFWANYHWAGKQDDLETRMKSFEESLADIRKKNNNDIAPFVHTPFPMTYTKQEEEFDPTTIWDNLFGKNKSSIVDNVTNKEYDHGGVHLPVAESDATYAQQPQFNIPVAQEEQYVDQFGSTGGSLYPSGPEPTFWEKITNAAANPLATFGYSARGEDIPWGNVPRHSNPFDTFALGMVNPGAWLESGQASMDAAKKGDYLGAGLEGLGALPYFGAAAHLGRKFAPQTSALLQKTGIFPKIKHMPDPIKSININKSNSNHLENMLQKRKDYLLSEEYITKRAANTGESRKQIKAQTDVYLDELDNTTLSLYKKGDLGKNVYGQYSELGIDVAKGRSNKEIFETIDHEIGHLLSPVNRSAQGSNPHTNVIWKDKSTGKRLTNTEANMHKGDLDFETNPKWLAWEKYYGDKGKIYKNYPIIKIESKGDEEFAKYLMKPQEQQVRMVRYGEVLKKYGWDGTKKGLTNEIIDKANTVGGKVSLPRDVQQLLRNMKGIDAGSPEWYAQIKKTLPYAWSMAPVAATTKSKKKK